MRKQLLIVFALLNILFIKASIEVNSVHMTTNDGIADNSVRNLFQDSKGFIWMGTLNGLSRYDGYSFVTYRPGKEGISLADQRIKNISEDNNGFLWVSTTPEKFSCYDLRKEVFVDYTGCGEYDQYYSSMTICRDSSIWLWHNGNGCRHVIYKDGQFSSESFKKGNGKLPTGNVRYIFENNDGKIFIGTDNGITRFDGDSTNIFSKGHQSYAATSFNNDLFFVSTKGEIVYGDILTNPTSTKVDSLISGINVTGVVTIGHEWIIFTNHGGYVFNMNDKTISQRDPFNIKKGNAIVDNKGNCWIFNHSGNLLYVNSSTGNIKRFRLFPNDKMGYIDYERFNIVHDSQNIIWISTYGNGLFAYEPDTDELTHITSDMMGNGHIKSNFLHFVMEDNMGHIWACSEYTGVSLLSVLNNGAYRIYPEDENLTDRSNTIRLISVLKGGEIWVGSRNGGLYKYDTPLNNPRCRELNKSSIYALTEDSRGRKWMGSRGNGLCVDGEWYKNEASDSGSISNNNIFSMLNDNKDRMWVGTFGGGLNLAYFESGRIRFRKFLNRTYGMRQIRALAKDQDGWIWAGTSDGLCIFHPDSIIADSACYRFYDYGSGHLSNNEIKCILEDSKNNMWIGSSGGGISLCHVNNDRNEMKTRHFGVSDGLVNEMVQSIVEDKYGRLWVATEYGISYFDHENRRFRNMFFSTFPLGNVYCDNSANVDPNGLILIGSNHGLVVIDPDKIVAEEIPCPDVAMTNLLVNGIKMYASDKDSPLSQALVYSNDITLEHYQNSIAIDFSIFDHSHSGNVKYSYRLDNYDEKWSTPSGMNFAAYKNLSPGTYRLRVKACNSQGIWSVNPTTLKITIRPPFWKSVPAIIIYLILICLIAYLIFRLLKDINALRNRIKLEKQLTEYKLKFFTNISHEFRTPLTLIQGAMERIHQTKDIPLTMEYSLEVMDKSINRMLRLVNQLLEFRKMQNNKLALALEKSDIIGFVKEICATFGQSASSRNIDYRIQSSSEDFEMYIDRSALDKIAYNLLSNAFKFTRDNGLICCDMRIAAEQNLFILSISDNGAGIPEEKQKELFSRFMHTNMSKTGGSGVGLNLTYELVKLLKGAISYSENPGGGSVFTVSLPIDENIYHKDDFLTTDAEPKKSEKTFISTSDYENIITDVEKRYKILVIEDDIDVREFLKTELGMYFRVDTVNNGESGLKHLESSDADLIICDVLMPGITGFEVTRKLKSSFNSSHIPVILLTAMSGDENKYEGLRNGADAYLTKPFSPKLLIATISNLIRQREMLKEKFSSTPEMHNPQISTTDHDKEFAERLQNILEDEIENQQFSVDDFASRMNLGRTVFYRKVRGVTGYTPNEYIRVVRMKKAAELVKENRFSISEISYKVGISDPFYFSKCFKQQFGMPPSQYAHKEASANE